MGLLDEPGEKLQNTNHKIQTNSRLQCPKLQTAISRHWTGTFSDVTDMLLTLNTEHSNHLDSPLLTVNSG
jgi:hypothetical protein